MSLQIYLENLINIDPNISVVIKECKLEEIKSRIISRYNSLTKFSKKLDCSIGFLSSLLRKERKSCKYVFGRKCQECLD